MVTSAAHTHTQMTGSGCLSIPTALLVLHVLIHVNTTRATVLALVRQKHSFFLNVLTGRMKVVVLRAELRVFFCVFSFTLFSADLHC